MNKKRAIIIGIILLLCLIGVGITYYYTNEDENSLTISQKKWIENNKNQLIDMSILNDVPVLSNSGEGVLFDFLNDLEEDTGLEFNKLSYDSDASSEYAFKTTNEVSDSDIVIYEDNYALVTKTKVKYTSLDEIKNIVIGVLTDDMTTVSSYISESDVTYKSYDSYDDMIDDIDSDDIDGIVIPRLEYLDKIITNDNLNIAYNITEYSINYVLSLGSNEDLNDILTSYFESWKKQNEESDFNTNLINYYFEIKEVSEKDQTKFRSKRYSYGFMVNTPFDYQSKDGLLGYNYSLLNSFSQSASIEIDYKKYSSIETLLEDFNSNDLDIIFDYHKTTNYNMDVYNSVSVYSSDIAIISSDSALVVNSVNSLKGKEVLTVENTKIDEYLKENGVSTKTYQSISSLISHLDKDELAAIDYYSYDYYVRGDLDNFKIIGIIDLDSDYGFVSRDISANETFNELFDFYLSFENISLKANNSYQDILNDRQTNRVLKYLLVTFSAILLILFGVLVGKFWKYRKSKKTKLTKNDKLRYVDAMTSLKNRNYLNDNINKWDNSDVYPQAIIIIDLNNIAYINDNFGHEEGDKIIIEGASVLINNQLSNSEIIRSNGNEFLIFIVGTDEKEIITYIRKLHKEFKKLSHGFGAAIGYSMIVDEIKTIDDAVNEATADMRSNKEDK